MQLYKKNTVISITASGGGEEIHDFKLPYPDNYYRYNQNTYTIEYIINGFFHTEKGIRMLNDMLARFTFSFDVKNIETRPYRKNVFGGWNLKYFQNLNSISKIKNYEKVDNGQDNVFWSIKLYLESLIKEHGEGKLIAYSLIETYAYDRFVDRVKDKSTLRAKCRSIWNWYNEREWIIPTRGGLGMSRVEAGINAGKKNAEATKARVVGAIASLKFLNKKINIANVAEQGNVSRDTAKKYLIQLGLKKEKN